VSTLSRLSSKLRDVKINIKQDGFSKTFKSLEQDWLPSNKTALTVIWIIVSIMAGELIIYKHQNLFSSYITNASDLNYARSVSTTRDSREKYDTSVNSTSKLYQNILTRYASEENNKRSVSDKVNKIASERGVIIEDAAGAASAKAVLSFEKTAYGAVKSPEAETRAANAAKIQGANGGRVIVHRVKQGETLAHISKKYFKTTSKYKQIAVQNNLKSPYSLKRGDKLIIVLR